MDHNFDKEFDRLFAADLRMAGKEAHIEVGEWQALSERLDRANKPGVWQKLPWLLVLLLALSNIGLWYWFSTRPAKTVPPASTPIMAIHTPEVAAPSITPIVVRDTIYKTLVLRRSSTAQVVAMPAIVAVPGSAEIREHQERPSLLLPVERAWPVLTSASEARLPAAIPNIVVVAQPEKDTLRAVSFEGKKGTANRSIPVQAVAIQGQASGTGVSQALNTDTIAASPIVCKAMQHWQCLISMGFGHGGRWGKLIETNNAFVVNTSIEMGREGHWAVVLGLQIQSLEYKLNRYLKGFSDIPELSVPGPNFDLRTIEGHQKMLLPSLALQYRFRPRQRCSWYVGSGLGKRLTIASPATYTFINRDTGSPESRLSGHLVSHGFNIGCQAGAEYRFRARWSAYTSANTWLDVQDERYSSPVYAIVTGIKYRLY